MASVDGPSFPPPSDMHPCLSFTFVHEIYFLLGDKEKTPKPFPFLELNLLPILYSNRTFIIQHTVNVKDSSPYSITPYSSAHPNSVKIAKITTTRHRLIILSSTEQYFDDSWLAYRFRLFRAGYPVALIKSHEGGRLWKNKSLIIAGMEKRAAMKSEIGWLISKPPIEDLVIPMILPAHVGTKRFFSEAQNSGLLTFDNFPSAAKEHLPTKLMKCLSKTASLSDGLGKGPKLMPP
mmetsp:Transcript_84117/g.136359  ORF Transcript_84117/g.136359 Transcript_84117/m.136359 type:complete len:235 (-) Transcript_84117:961-1665(-)